MRLILLLAFLSSCVSSSMKYNYASSDARTHCALNCPGNKCLCIMGTDNTWYLSPEIGDEE